MGKMMLGKKGNSDFFMPEDSLKKHFIALGSSGSGKTVLCKTLVEEAIMNGLPAILLDPQGDLASLALVSENASPEFKDKLKKTRITIYTPTSSKGIPICINPLKLPQHGIDEESLISVLHQISNAIASLVGYDLESDNGKGAQIAVYELLMSCYKSKKELSSFSELADKLASVSDSEKKRIYEFITEGEMKKLIRKIKYLTVGEHELMFQLGVPLDIGSLLSSDKNQISIIYLNTLENQSDKDFFVSMLATELYQWMLSNPSSELQALFYIDEIAPYLPAGALKPLAKPMLTLLFKQARKYGIGCIISTQNPGDIDYKAFAQFGTWAIGRLTTKQDQEKVKDALESIAGPKINSIIDELPKLKPGEFFIFSPDYFNEIAHLKVRTLYTEHKTLSDKQVKDIMDSTRSEYEPLYVKKSQYKPVVHTEAKGTTKEMHLPVNIDRERISQIAEAKKKKQFGFFGKTAENVESLELVMKPILRAKVQMVEKKILKKEINEYEIYFNGANSQVMIFRGTDFEQRKASAKLIELTDSEMAVLKHLMGKEKTNATDIALKLKLTSGAVSKTLNNLNKQKLVSFTRTAEKSYLWFLITDIDVSQSINKVCTNFIEMTDAPLDNVKIEKPEVDSKKLSAFVRSWFGGEISQLDTVYYPVYELRLAGRSKTRVICISAVTGKEMENLS
jgi:DNA helicase HerA-like ATPase/predicted transcriptional regulator